MPLMAVSCQEHDATVAYCHRREKKQRPSVAARRTIATETAMHRVVFIVAAIENRRTQLLRAGFSNDVCHPVGVLVQRRDNVRAGDVPEADATRRGQRVLR